MNFHNVLFKFCNNIKLIYQEKKNKSSLQLRAQYRFLPTTRYLLPSTYYQSTSTRYLLPRIIMMKNIQEKVLASAYLFCACNMPQAVAVNMKTAAWNREPVNRKPFDASHIPRDVEFKIEAERHFKSDNPSLSEHNGKYVKGISEGAQDIELDEWRWESGKNYVVRLTKNIILRSRISCEFLVWF